MLNDFESEIRSFIYQAKGTSFRTVKTSMNPLLIILSLLDCMVFSLAVLRMLNKNLNSIDADT